MVIFTVNQKLLADLNFGGLINEQNWWKLKYCGFLCGVLLLTILMEIGGGKKQRRFLYKLPILNWC